MTETKNIEKVNRYRRRLQWPMVFVLILAVLPFLWQCSGKQEINPNLLGCPLSFDMPGNAEERFREIIEREDLAGNFKRDPVNIFFKNHPWMGRVRDNEVSYHALFAVDDSTVTCDTENPGAGELLFTIYHPRNSQLTYSVYIESSGKKEKVFTKSFKEKSFFDGSVPLPGKPGDQIKISMSTTGKGIGAWINPRMKRKKKAPRVVVVMVLDTLRYDHTSVYGYHRKTTPFMEKLAQDGTVFKHAFSTTSWTLPTHVSLFSGKDLSEHGVVAPGDSISLEYPMAAELFQKRGFVTAAFTGGGFVEDSYGFYRGFQYYSNAPGNVFSMNSAERVLSHFKNYMERFRGDDLFVFLHTYQVHSPYKAPRSYVDRIDKNIEGNLLGITNFIKRKNEFFKPLEEKSRRLLIDLYDASILYTDEVLVGGVINYLKENGYYDNSLVAVLSDHGEEFYEHGSWEHGHTLYNELVRIPLVVKFPAVPGSAGNKVDNSLVSISDVPGMLLEGCGFEGTGFEVKKDEKNRMLPVLFPVSPIIKQFPPKISFVDGNYHFIYNIIDREKMTFFNPQPRKLEAYELYKLSDEKEKKNLHRKEFKTLQQYQKAAKIYKKKLEQMQRMKKSKRKRKLDKDLEKKLKSLGYLGD